MFRAYSERENGRARTFASSETAGLGIPVLPVMDDLVVYLQRANPGTGSTWNDAGPNGLNATLTGATWVSDVVNMTGSPDYAYIPYNATYMDFTGTDEITIAMWIYWDAATDSYNAVFSNDNSGGINFLLKSNQQMAIYFTGGSVLSVDGGGSTVPQGQWCHVAMVWNGSNIQTYIDGVLNQDSPESGNYVNPAVAWEIGKGGTFGRYFDGKISDVVIYARGLSGGEIALLHGMGAP